MKLFEIILYIALMAFVFSGYVIFAGDFAKFVGNSTVHKKILLEDYLPAEYLRWNIYNKFSYDIYGGAVNILNNSTSTVLSTLSRINPKKVEDFSYSIELNASNTIDMYHNQSVEFYIDYKDDRHTFNILLP